MIVRLMGGEGQLRVPDEQIEELQRLDDQLEAAIEAADEAAFGTALSALVDAVHELGIPLEAEEFLESDFILPPADASMAEVSSLLSDSGLIPD